ncbi:MAG TPA: DUF3352 domain-containing protein, partial [Ktedonobacterales bacterium]|nr:DUF3352 domain-containing protein [Ktedonobacterales bacterium]
MDANPEQTQPALSAEGFSSQQSASFAPTPAITDDLSTVPGTVTPDQLYPPPYQPQPYQALPPAQSGTWAGQYLPTPMGMEALGATAIVQPGKPVRSHRLRNTLTLISSVVILALLVSGAYYLYAAFFNSPQAAARILPDQTFLYASVDLTATANNNHHVTIDDLAQTFGVGSSLRSEGLNWQQDVAPWVGRNIAIAAYPTTNDSATLSNTGGSPTNPVSTAASILNVGYAELLQSHDDAKAQAAMAKAANAQRKQGQSVKKISYGGLTLYSVNDPGAELSNNPNAPAQTLGAGKGWAIIASSVAAAEIVVDRINGQGSTLASAAAFQDATNNLPSSRFGTLYLNLRGYYNLVVSLAPGPTQGALDFPFVDTYPVAGGYLSWSSLGIRAQLTFNAVKSADIPTLSGDTTSLAAYAPA